MVLEIKYFGSKSERSNFLYSFFKTVTTHSVNEENSYKDSDYTVFSPVLCFKRSYQSWAPFLNVLCSLSSKNDKI